MTATDTYRPYWWRCSRCGELRLQSQKPDRPHDCPRNATDLDPVWIGDGNGYRGTSAASQ